MEHSKNYTIGYGLSKTHYYMRTIVGAMLRSNGIPLTYEQWVVLKTIGTFSGHTQSYIGEKCHKDKTNITRMVDLLERDGFVRRKKDEEDRRKYLLQITDSGTEVLKQVLPLIQVVDKLSDEVLSEKEKQTLISLLNRVSDRLKQDI